jgi:alkylated DNA repair dioxygenase AlkB
LLDRAEQIAIANHTLTMLLPLQRDPNSILDGPFGAITYFPECIAAGEADRWFEILQAETPWSAERRRMYERDVDVPRLTAHFALDDPALPAPLMRARTLAERLAKCEFNSVGLNLYRNGSDSVAPHNDKLHELAAGAPIALVSLGATRRMIIRSKKTPRRRLELDLDNGSVLVMSYETQLHLEHAIPKTATPVGPRISLAFRRRPPAAA